VALGLALGWVAPTYLTVSKPATPARAVRTTIVSPPATSVRLGWKSGIALSPDGRSLVYVGLTAEGDSVLFLRPLDALEARPIPGTEGA
jgi:hypothetical protein